MTNKHQWWRSHAGDRSQTWSMPVYNPEFCRDVDIDLMAWLLFFRRLRNLWEIIIIELARLDQETGNKLKIVLCSSDQEKDSKTTNLLCEFQPDVSDVFLLTGGTYSLIYPTFIKSFFCHMQSCQRTQSSWESPFTQTTAKQPGRKVPISFPWFHPWHLFRSNCFSTL